MAPGTKILFASGNPDTTNPKIIEVSTGSDVVDDTTPQLGGNLDTNSHNILFDIAPEVKVETVSEKGKNPIVKLSSHDKQLLGYVAAKIRSFRKPEPYKGKGVKFVGEQIRRKAGKSA